MPKLAKTKELSTMQMVDFLQIEQAAYDSGFYNRQPRKITASAFIKGYYRMQQKGKNSLCNLAIQVGSEIGQSVSKQAIDNRFNEHMLDMVNRILLTALNQKQLIPDNDLDLKYFQHVFGDIILHDSTIEQVANKLYEQVGGNKTSHGPRALIRLQTCYNLSKHTWLGFSVDPYKRNDQSQVLFPLPMLNKNDLLIRDLGYFKLDTLQQISKQHYFITALRPGVKLYDEYGQLLCLLDYLRVHKNMDAKVLVGSSNKLPLRLVASQLSKKKTREKIARAKKNAHASNKYDEDYYELLGYEIYLTNVDQMKIDGVQIAKLYGLRWYIEILFKSWKSYFNFKTMFNRTKMNYHRTFISFYLNLILFVYLHQYWYNLSRKHVYRKGKTISILKFMNVVSNLIEEVIQMQSQQQLEKILDQMAKHATYDKRHKRKNMIQKKQKLLQTIAKVA